MLLDSQPDIEVVAAVSTVGELMDACDREQPNTVVFQAESAGALHIEVSGVSDRDPITDLNADIFFESQADAFVERDRTIDEVGRGSLSLGRDRKTENDSAKAEVESH